MSIKQSIAYLQKTKQNNLWISIKQLFSSGATVFFAETIGLEIVS